MGCELDARSQKFLRQTRTLGLSLRRALKVWKRLKTDLNDGMGEPWAGQERSKGLPDNTSRLSPSLFNVNFGIEPPIGSESLKESVRRGPEAGNGRPLGRAGELKGISSKSL